MSNYVHADKAQLPLQSRLMATPGQRIRSARLARKWSQEDLARVSGVSLKTISRIENDAHDNPRMLSQVFEAVGINTINDDDATSPRLEESSPMQFAGELLRRLERLSELEVLARTLPGQTGSAPPPVLGQEDEQGNPNGVATGE